MTRIMTNPELIKSNHQRHGKEWVLWSEQLKFFPAPVHAALVSTNIPDGSIIHEVQLQCTAVDDIHAVDITLNLALVESELPTLAEVQVAEPVIDWRWVKTGKAWHSICKYTNEVYRCRKVVRGSNRRLAITAQTTHVNGALARVSVLYEVP